MLEDGYTTRNSTNNSSNDLGEFTPYYQTNIGGAGAKDLGVVMRSFKSNAGIGTSGAPTLFNDEFLTDTEKYTFNFTQGASTMVLGESN
jgi:hypothetical protein